MTFLYWYLAITSACMVRAWWINRRLFADYDVFCSAFGMCVLWPVTFTLLGVFCWQNRGQ